FAMVFSPIESGANGALLCCPIQRARVNQLEVLLIESAPVVDGKEKMSSLEEIDCSAQRANADAFIPGRKYCPWDKLVQIPSYSMSALRPFCPMASGCA